MKKLPRRNSENRKVDELRKLESRWGAGFLAYLDQKHRKRVAPSRGLVYNLLVMSHFFDGPAALLALRKEIEGRKGNKRIGPAHVVRACQVELKRPWKDIKAEAMTGSGATMAEDEDEAESGEEADE